MVLCDSQLLRDVTLLGYSKITKHSLPIPAQNEQIRPDFCKSLNKKDRNLFPTGETRVGSYLVTILETLNIHRLLLS